MLRENPTMIEREGAVICTETFGSPDNPAILLIMGSGASMDWWPTEFCERLASWDHFVIRYDHRDTGRSSNYEVGAPPYGLNDLADDALAIVDALRLARVHLVGMSMGGAIAQLLALDHPERVESLTLIASSPVQVDADEPELPSMSAETIARFSRPEPDPDDPEAVIDYLLALAEASASPDRQFEREEFRALGRVVVERSNNIAATLTNHNRIDFQLNPSCRLDELRLPTLVLHGRDDPVLPFEHGAALARHIPGARLVALERTGHELPRSSWLTVIPEILCLTSAVETAV